MNDLPETTNTVHTPAVKWLTLLLCLHLVSAVISWITYLPIPDGWATWVQRTISVGVILCLFLLTSARSRYRKAAFFRTAVFCCSLLSIFFSLQAAAMILALLSSICSIFACWQEFHGHAELIGGIKEKLARSWLRLFWCELILGILAWLVVVLVPVLHGDFIPLISTISSIPAVLTDILGLVHLLLLYLTVHHLKQP